VARDFSASSDKIVVADYAAIHNLTQRTMSVWAYFDAIGSGNFDRPLLTQGVSQSTKLSTPRAANDIKLEANRWATDGVWNWSFGGIFMTGSWHHFLVTYDYGSLSNNPTLYRDGATLSPGEVSPAGALSDEDGDFIIGNNAAGDRTIDGRLAEVAEWNRILTVEEMGRVFRGSPDMVPSGLVLYLPLLGLESPEPNLAQLDQPGTVTGTSQIAGPWTYSGRRFHRGG
jgi:hypothetical protein